MSNTFNIKRFGLLLKKQWLDIGKIYLISLAVIAGVITIMFGFNIPAQNGKWWLDNQGYFVMSFRVPTYLIIGFIFLTVISSWYFSLMGQKSKAALELMVPASILEKFLAGVFYTSFLSIFSYMLIFYIIDSSYVIYLNQHLGEFISKDLKVNHGAITLFKQGLIIENRNAFISLLSLFLAQIALTGLFLLGSIYFNRFHYIKTAVVTMLFSGLAFYVIYKSAELLTAGMVRKIFSGSDGDSLIIFIPIAIALLTLILWIIGYVRLKEKEV